MRQLSHLDYQDKVDLLVMVESNTASHQPLWSALLTDAGDEASLRLHRDVSHRLGRSVPISDADFINQLTTECIQLHRP
ncbi:hypothetical protein ACIPWL_28650 [Streptomyces sp. NPDC090023]|uniref:hypothetical protein n=1 Tax=unclassified Streptomyces TaxID=2593676 RepID=UPI00382FDFBD